MNKLAYLMSKVANKEDLTPAERDELIVLMEQVQSGSAWANGIADGPSGIAGAVIKTGSGNIIQDETGLKLYDDSSGTSLLTGWLQLDGDWYVGSNLASADTTSLSIFSNAQTYNGESMGAGDVLFGSNSSGYANMLWDMSAKQLKFRGGTTVQAYVGTDGVIYAGAGVVKISALGIFIIPSTAIDYTRSFAFNDGTNYLSAYSHYISAAGDISQTEIATSSLSTYDEKIVITARCTAGKSALSEIIAQDHLDYASANHISYVKPYVTSASAGVQLYAKNGATIKIGAFTSTGFQLNTGGQVIDEFSIDGTFAGNSDTAVPTEKATKTYMDARVSGGGTVASGGFTLTVPATGTAALLGTANVFTASQTINAGFILHTGTASYQPQYVLTAVRSAADAGYFNFQKARGAVGALELVNASDNLGTFVFRGYDGAAYQNACGFSAIAGATPAANDMPGILLFQTTPEGSTTMSEALRMTSTQMVLVAKGLYVGSNTGTATDNDIIADGTIQCADGYYIGANQVVGARVVDARCDDAINSGDATTDGVIDALRDAMISHGLIAAA